MSASDAFIGEIRMFAFDFPPNGWVVCDGSLVPIVKNVALFSILGTTYGGDGTTNFALPNFTGIAPMAPGLIGGRTIVQGQAMGEPLTSLQATEIPVHSHGLQRKGALKPLQDKTFAPSPTSNLASVTGVTQAGVVEPIPSFVKNGIANTTLAPEAVEFAGGGKGHENMQPYLVLNYCICVSGLFPAR